MKENIYITTHVADAGDEGTVVWTISCNRSLEAAKRAAEEFIDESLREYAAEWVEEPGVHILRVIDPEYGILEYYTVVQRELED